MASSEISVQVGPSAFLAHVQAGKHEFVVDEPEDSGGQDSGPDPHELLLASLGTCAAITIRMYANRKEWPLKKIEIRVAQELVEYGDISIPEADQKPLDEINITIKLSGNLSPGQVQRIKMISEKCPVHKKLMCAFTILTEVVLVPTV